MAIFHTLHIVSDNRHVVFFGDHKIGSIWLSRETQPCFQAEPTSNGAPILLNAPALVQLAFLVKSFGQPQAQPKAPPGCERTGTFYNQTRGLIDGSCVRLAGHLGPCTTVKHIAEKWDAEDARERIDEGRS